MKNAPSIEEKILAVLTKPCTAAEAGLVRSEAERELAAVTAEADRLDTAAVDWKTSESEAAGLRQQADALRLVQDRLTAKVSALSVRVADLLDLEARSARKTELDAALAERDELAADIAREYPQYVAGITRLVQRVIANDTRLHNAGNHTSAEFIGRGIHRDFATAIRLQSIKLPLPAGQHLAFQNTMAGWRFPGLELAE